MKIGIDASRAFLAERTGTEEYSYQLIKNLARTAGAEIDFILYVKKSAKIDLDLPRNFFVRKIGGDFLWTQFFLSREMIKREIDALFIPSHSVPLIHPEKTAVTIHGLEYKRFPDCYPLKARIATWINTLPSIFFSRKIIVPSESTKKDLMDYYKVDPKKIKVISHGVEKRENVRGKDNRDEYQFNVLFVGRLEKRKNIIGIIRAFNDFADKAKNISEPERRDKKINLILTGRKGFGFGEIEKEISASAYKNNIFLPGYVTEEEKRKLYSDADIFLFPTFYEGFGIPVLEAMSYGVPVVCSNFSSLPEIAGRAALLVDPARSEDISSALLKLFRNGRLRDKLTDKGYKNIERFSWRKCADETLEILKNM